MQEYGKILFCGQPTVISIIEHFLGFYHLAIYDRNAINTSKINKRSFMKNKMNDGFYLVLLISIVFGLASCANHFKTGMNAYADKEYGKAVDELSQVKSEHEDYNLAMAVLVKAEFKLALEAFSNAKDPKEAIESMKKMIPLAMKTKSKDILKEASSALMDKLREAKDSEFIKTLLMEKFKLAF